ncbi:MAG TPA: gephyrin-like molybdotransferase Glp [Pseudonocardia sp.]|jgi:molybdopterin molybdotransferase|nr:gephyrin-like molybdotransferase Glp [Pseudonocardia sp.]
MTTVEEHRAVVASLLAPMPAEDVALYDARGRVLAADVVAATALPSFDNSAMDGYAVRAAEVAGAPVALPVAFDIPAGRTDVPPLPEGAVARIMTGAPVPEGADAIVPVEQTDGGTEVVAIKAAAEVGTYVRRAGEDVAAGDVVLAAGTVLGPAQIGVAAATGHARVPVSRRPVVLVLSTGSELVAPGAPLQHGQIYESNGPMLAAAVEDAGARAELLRFVPDDVEQFLAVLAERAVGVDLVLTSGGVSAGAHEVVKDALAGRGVTFGKVAMQPGGPQGAGRLDGGVPVVTLPGNPVSSLVSFEVFVRPVLRAALGHPHPERPVVVARLAQRLTSPSGRRQFRRGVLDAREGTVAEIGGPPSHLLGSLAKADCLFVVPEDVTELVAGSEVAVWLLDG